MGNSDGIMATAPVAAGEWRAWRSCPALRRLPAMRRRYRSVLRRERSLLTVCNEPYLAPHASFLARSLERHAPGNRLHLHLVNPETRMIDEVGRLQSECPRTPISWTCERIDFGDRGDEFVRAYCAAIRLVRAYQLLFLRRRPLLVLDADSIVRAPLDPLWDAVGTADIAARTRFGDRRDYLKFALGTLYLGWSGATLDFMRKVARRLAQRIDSGKLEWFDDQLAVYEAYGEVASYADGVRLMQLPAAFADWDFEAGSVIWAGKGPRKVEDSRYLDARHELQPGQAHGDDRAPRR